MNLTKIFSEDIIFFTTREFALISDLELSAASHYLSRLEKQSLITKITRGLWANHNHPYFSPIAAVTYLLGNEQGYVSFLTALNRHSVISQIPQTIQVATTGKSKTLETKIGNFEFFRLDPALMQDGILWSDSKISYPIACPEKALIDTLYISTRKGKRFDKLPELDLDQLNLSKLKLMLNTMVKDPRIKSSMLSKLQSF